MCVNNACILRNSYQEKGLSLFSSLNTRSMIRTKPLQPKVENQHKNIERCNDPNDNPRFAVVAGGTSSWR